eukprot:GGOE01010502.1.p1 GENE.GGOE01010502.1~~GGOE01010502.1.p1  ORF type:complete len:284 (+),score=17.40 GGOE01010502.1:58-909(+)
MDFIHYIVLLFLFPSLGAQFDVAKGNHDFIKQFDFQQYAPANQTWAPLHLTFNKGIFFTTKKVIIAKSSQRKCQSGVQFLYAFHLEDIFSVGHMHRTFTTFFSYLLTVPSHSKVAAIWGQSLNYSRHSSAAVKALVYEPMLQMYQRFFSKHRGLQIQVFENVNTTKCLHAQQLGERQCILGNVPKLVAGTTGNCGNWFASAKAVAAWRAMLASEGGLEFPLHNIAFVPSRSPWAPWSILVYDRPHSRRFAGSTPNLNLLNYSTPLRQHQGIFPSHCIMFGCSQ